jgi:serine/threonine protein kinase
MQMNYEDRWQIIERIGSGGQGVVYRVWDKNRFNIDDKFIRDFSTLILGLSGSESLEKKKEYFDEYSKIVNNIIQLQNPINHGALKVLHEPTDARDFTGQEERLKREIAAMKRFSHPNLLEIIDTDPQLKWYVSRFYPNGTLDKNIQKFKGDIISSLKAIRNIVLGVAELHKNGIVHRDIKPHNIFIDENENLILGDFGLVFFTDQSYTRISGTFENVGSTNWMPGWSTRMRVEDVKPTFDIFSLGKVLWAMISGLPVLRLWYFKEPDFNLENLFPASPSMKLVNKLFEKCIVERENNCIPNASDLLNEIDYTIEMLEKNYDLIDNAIQRKCKVCGNGTYELKVDRDPKGGENYGFETRGGRTYKVFACNNCGHIQLFLFGDNKDPVAWN